MIVLDTHVWLWWATDYDKLSNRALDEICVTAPMLPGLRDPNDQIITATALHHRVPLVTKDQRIRDSELVETIW